MASISPIPTCSPSRMAAATSASMSTNSASSTRSTPTACSIPARCAASWPRDSGMQGLYVYCHPLDDSCHAGIRKEALAGLQQAGHTVDLLDLDAGGFAPGLSAERRGDYHDPVRNRPTHK